MGVKAMGSQSENASDFRPASYVMNLGRISAWISKVDPSFGLGDTEEEGLDSTIEEEAEQYFRLKSIKDRFLSHSPFVTHKDRLGPPNNGVTTMSHLVKEDAFYLALGGAIINPGHFYINPLQSWNILERMMAAIQKAYDQTSMDGADLSLPWEGHLTPGFYVIAKCRPENEWHRAQILEILEDGKYKVKLIDYGDVVIVHIEAIRYLKRRFWETLPPQAIRCSPQLSPEKKNWTILETNNFHSKIFNKTLAIHFKKRAKINEEIIGWKVFLHIYDKDLKKITKFHVEQELVEEFSWEDTDCDHTPTFSLLLKIDKEKEITQLTL